MSAEPMARGEQGFGRGVPDRESKHDTQRPDAIAAALFGQVKDRFGVARRAEPMTAAHEAAAQFLVVIDLAVEDDQLRSVFVEDRLPAPAQVDNAEAAHSQTDGPVHINPFVVRTAMLQRITLP